jgi:hypothetical protein
MFWMGKVTASTANRLPVAAEGPQAPFSRPKPGDDLAGELNLHACDNRPRYLESTEPQGTLVRRPNR